MTLNTALDFRGEVQPQLSGRQERTGGEWMQPGCNQAPAYRTGEAPSDSVRAVEGQADSQPGKASTPKTLQLHRSDACCERVGVGERREAPPGFEPGVADLQSARAVA